MKYEDIRIAFIARLAPGANASCPLVTDKMDYLYAEYHYDIYRILSNLATVRPSNNAQDLLQHHDETDYVFSLLNRAPYRNSEIFISSLCEYYNIPYLGARPNTRALAEDKQLAKLLAEYCGVKTARWISYNCHDRIPSELSFPGPYFVKPRYGAASAFIDESSICQTANEVRAKANELYGHGMDVIIEEFIDGVFYSNPVLFINSSLTCFPPVKETTNLRGNVITYLQKRRVQPGVIKEISPDQELNNRICLLSQKLSSFIQPFDYARFDYMVTAEGEIYFLEFNLCCNLGRYSTFVTSSNSAGYSQDDVVQIILDHSLRRQGVI